MSSLIAVVAGYVRALKHIAKDDGGKARFLHYLQRSLTREIVEGFIGSQVMVTLSKTLEALCKDRCAHPTYIEQTEKDARLQLTNRMKRSGVSDIREEVGNPHRGAIPILLATVVFDRNGLEELLSIPGGEWAITPDAQKENFSSRERKRNMSLKEGGKNNAFTKKMLRRYKGGIDDTMGGDNMSVWYDVIGEELKGDIGTNAVNALALEGGGGRVGGMEVGVEVSAGGGVGGGASTAGVFGSPPVLPLSAAALETLGTTRAKFDRFMARADSVEVPIGYIFPSSTNVPSPFNYSGFWGGLTAGYVDNQLRRGAKVVADEADARRYAPWAAEYLKVIMPSAKGSADRYWACLGGTIATLDKGDNTLDKYGKVLGELMALEISEGNKWLKDLPCGLPRDGEGGEVSVVWMGMDFSIGECCQC